MFLKTTPLKPKKHIYGILSEFLIIIFLFFKGYKILKRRLKYRCGEIDILAVRNNTLIAVEVKYRTNISTIEEVLSDYQKNRIANATMVFVSRNKKYNSYNIRFDLVLLNPYIILKHIKGFWD